MNHTIEVEWEQVDAIVVKELKSMYEDLAPEKRPSFGVWHKDAEEDIKEMKKMRKALKRVLAYMGEKV